jgi:GTP cyclohydrolase I
MSSSPVLKNLEDAYKAILSSLPLTEEGISRTPLRAAKALLDLTKGYSESLEEVIGHGVFPYSGSGIVHVKGLEICSLCEHHLLPFIGSCSITYIPDKKILGLSKLKRIANIYARRLQVQERLTDQIADAIEKSVQPKGVLVVVRSTHMCMKMRGVTESDSETTTVASRGQFNKDENLKLQYYNDSNSRPKI